MTFNQCIGDGYTLRLPLRYDGRPYNPTGANLICTFKASSADADLAAKIQKATSAGITIENVGIDWFALVEIIHADTVDLAPGTLVFDVQAQLGAASPVTVHMGELVLRRDVTRGLNTSIPINTTQPPLLLNGEQITAEFEAVNDRIDNLVLTGGETGAVSSVNGRTGAVVITKSDLTLGNVDNTADSAKPVSTAQSAAISAAVSVEASRAVIAETSLTSRLSTEEGARGTAVTSLSTRLSTEESNRVVADASVVALIAAAGGGDMLKSENLAGLANVATARTNLGLGTAATTAATDYAPASEVATRSTADASLATRISGLDTQAANLATADGSLTTRVTAAESVTASLSASASTGLSQRVSADTSLSTRISSEESTRLSAVASVSTTVSTLSVGAVGPDLTAIEALTGTGYAQRTGDGVWVLSTPSGSGGVTFPDAAKMSGCVLVGDPRPGGNLIAANNYAVVYGGSSFKLVGDSGNALTLTSGFQGFNFASSTGAPTGARQSVIHRSTGTGWVGIECYQNPTNTIFGTTFLHVGWVKVYALSDGTNTYVLRFGGRPGITANNDTSQGAYLRYSHDVNSGAFQAFSRGESATTTTNLPVTVAINTWYKVVIETIPGASVNFWIDDVLVASHSTNIPTATGWSPGCTVAQLFRVAGTAAVDLAYADLRMAVIP